MSKSVDPDQTPRTVAIDLGLHRMLCTLCLPMEFCLSKYYVVLFLCW